MQFILRNPFGQCLWAMATIGICILFIILWNSLVETTGLYTPFFVTWIIFFLAFLFPWLTTAIRSKGKTPLVFEAALISLIISIANGILIWNAGDAVSGGYGLYDFVILNMSLWGIIIFPTFLALAITGSLWPTYRSWIWLGVSLTSLFLTVTIVPLTVT